jgi:hypothetical protein
MLTCRAFVRNPIVISSRVDFAHMAVRTSELMEVLFALGAHHNTALAVVPFHPHVRFVVEWAVKLAECILARRTLDTNTALIVRIRKE